MRRFGKGQMVWIAKDGKDRTVWASAAENGKLEPARYVGPGDDRGTHLVSQADSLRLVYTSDIVTQKQKNLEEAEKLLKS